MPSLAAACRIPAPVARLPIATARSIPRPVNSLSVARKYTPTVQRARPSTNLASLASSVAAMSISKPVNQAIAPPSASKPASSLPAVVVPCSKLAAERIQARRQKVIANLQPSKKRPTAPGSSRAVPPITITPVPALKNKLKPALKDKLKPSRVIPLPLAHAPPSIVVSPWIKPTSHEPVLRPRGHQLYCEGRPCELDCNGNRAQADYAPLYFFGISCTCHSAGPTLPTQHWIGPREWATTPAEADVDPARPRIVRFAENPVRSTRTISRWYDRVWPPFRPSTDPTTEEEDDATIHAMDNPPPGPSTETEDDATIPAIDNPPPTSFDFQSTWQALMDQGFPDDDEYL